MEVLPKLAYFTSKSYSRVLGYSVIKTKGVKRSMLGEE